MQLIWHQRKDGLWNAACSCNATVVGVPFERRAEAEAAHFAVATMERAFRASKSTIASFVRTENPERYANQIPPCGPKLPEPNPNLPGPLVFP
jgi:hypothetical protein